MGAIVFNIVVGLIFLIGGLMGELRLIGTGSTTAMAVVGGVILGIGLFQLVRHLRGR